MHALTHNGSLADILLQVLNQSLIITAFVTVMMLLMEHLNVFSEGRASRLLGGGHLRQYLLAIFLGATPGCLGAYFVVALYSHRRVSLGALTAAMIATSGDEAFVMLAMMPRTAILMTLGISLLALLVAALTDLVLHLRSEDKPELCCELDLHPEAERPRLSWRQIAAQWRQPSPHRAILSLVLALFALALATGSAGPKDWGWMRVTMLLLASGAFVSISVVPDHFLDEHLWQHIVVKHVPRIFLWTLGALLLVALLGEFVALPQLVSKSRWLVLGIAGLVGVIPESGPHLLFVSLVAKGAAPLSILVASSIVQDGHGMLPLLAHSRRDFFVVKGINLLAGLAVGAAMMTLGH